MASTIPGEREHEDGSDDGGAGTQAETVVLPAPPLPPVQFCPGSWRIKQTKRIPGGAQTRQRTTIRRRTTDVGGGISITGRRRLRALPPPPPPLFRGIDIRVVRGKPGHARRRQCASEARSKGCWRRGGRARGAGRDVELERCEFLRVFNVNHSLRRLVDLAEDLGCERCEHLFLYMYCCRKRYIYRYSVKQKKRKERPVY